MLQRQCSWLLLAALVSVMSGVIEAAPVWGSFARDNCVRSGYRKYYSRLWDISGDWGTACLTTPARVGPDNTYFVRPDVCVDKAIGGMWGEFFVRDTSCDPTWGSFKDDNCRATSGYRTYSSILWDIQGSWEEWCADTPATVRGILFPRATRCVNTGLNMWGEFDIYDPCCPSTTSPHTELRRRLLHDIAAVQVQKGGLGCSGAGDEPPFPNPRKISTATEFIDALRTGNYDPLDLIDYLWNALFQSSVLASSAIAVDFYCILYNSFNPPIVRFQDTPSTTYAAIRAMLIPTTLGGVLVNNGGVFPRGTFATIDLASPPAPIICTHTLTGCCMAFGWDNTNGRLFMGHVEPDTRFPQTTRVTDVANYLRKSPVFPASSQLTYREFFGRETQPGGYENYDVNIIGFISPNRIQIFFQVADRSFPIRKIIRRRMMDFRRE